MKPHILVISPGVLPVPPSMGGAVENLIYNLHDYLREEFELSYISVAPPEGLSGGKQYLMPEATFHYATSINSLKDFFPQNNFELCESSKSVQYAEFCQSVVQRNKFDLIHIHNEGQLVEIIRAASPASKIILHVNDEVVSRMDQRQLRNFSAAVNDVIACSDYIRREILSAFLEANVAAPHVRVIYNGVRTDVYDPTSLDEHKLANLRSSLGLLGKRVILFVGRMIEQKGPHLALRAVYRVAQRRVDVRLLFVGAPWYSRKNESPFIDYLAKEAESLQYPICFTGYIDQKDIPYYYGLAEVFLCPSIWDDPSPFVAYEAQAMTVPVVASERGGLPEIIEHGTSGYCIDVFNLPLFAERIRRLLDDKPLSHRMGLAGRTRIQQKFEMRIIAEQIKGIYRELLFSSVDF